MNDDQTTIGPRGPGQSKGKVKKTSNYSYAFRQQILKAWQPVPTLASTVCIFTVLGICFLALGLGLLFTTKDIWDLNTRYDDQCPTLGPDCSITINVNKDVDGPVFLYYGLNNFYQNHRRYLNSRDTSQLKGEVLSASDLSDCDPAKYMRDIGRTKSWGGNTLQPGDVANPCGLVARSFFNDTYQMFSSEGVKVQINEKGIAWESDIKHKFKRAPNSSAIQWIDVEDEHFIVWMRTAAVSKFQKLWGRIEDGLKKGTYVIVISNQYDVSSFAGEKYVYLSQANAFGGTNSFLAIAYLVVGSLSLLFAILFIINRKITRSKFLEIMKDDNKQS